MFVVGRAEREVARDPWPHAESPPAPRWLGVEVRHLAALKAVAEEGSFSRAAARLGYTQSAISQQIAALERIVQQRLLERPQGTQKVTLTRAGARLLEHANDIVARMSAAAADLDALAQEAVVRIGIFQSVAVHVLPAILAEIQRQNPAIELELTETTSDGDLLGLVESGELDVTFAMLPLPPGPFETVELFDDPYVLVVPAGSELTTQEAPPTFRDVATFPLIGFQSCRKLAQLEQEMRGRGIEPHFVLYSVDNATIQSFVANGSGIALVPRLTMNLDDERIAVVPLAAEVTPRVILLAWHKHRALSPASELFIAAAKAAASGLEQPDREEAITKQN